jgi:hypothetical protein
LRTDPIFSGSFPNEVSTNTWTDATTGGKTALEIEVDCTLSEFKLSPSYVTSLITSDPAPFALSGAAAIYGDSADGFKVRGDGGRRGWL